MRTTRALAALFLAAGCASMHVESQLAPEAELGRYRSFGWMPSDRKAPESIVDQQIRAALRRQLTGKGLQEVPADSADFLIGYHVLTERKIAVADWGSGIYGWAPDVVAYSDGALIVDFVDPQTNRVFWRGSASSAIEPPGLIDTRRLDRAATALVRRYPYGANHNVASRR
jgi:hypothetical protein